MFACLSLSTCLTVIDCLLFLLWVGFSPPLRVRFILTPLLSCFHLAFSIILCSCSLAKSWFCLTLSPIIDHSLVYILQRSVLCLRFSIALIHACLCTIVPAKHQTDFISHKTSIPTVCNNVLLEENRGKKNHNSCVIRLVSCIWSTPSHNPSLSFWALICVNHSDKGEHKVSRSQMCSSIFSQGDFFV